MNKIQILIGILFSVLLFSSSALAAFPSWYPKQFDLIGRVDLVSGNSIYIDDWRFIISPTVQFATPDNKSVSLQQLAVKDRIGVNIITINNRRLVDRIWLIPEDENSKALPPIQ